MRDEKRKSLSQVSTQILLNEDTSSNGCLLNSYEGIKDYSLWFKCRIPLIGTIRFNPIVSFISIVLIWTFVTSCIVIDAQSLPFERIKVWIVENFTWLYIGTQDIWAIFIVILYFSKYSKIKLGRDDEKPEFNDATWFMMLFACGIGTGLFFYGVAEPIFHYTTENRYYADRAMPDNQLAQEAINLTLYHWGIHAWIVYCLVGLILGLVAYREGLPMTMKSCLYPLIGDKIFGWMGDLIDIISVITTLFGVCTSLGLGTKQLSKGFVIISGMQNIEGKLTEVIIIWIITSIATLSTLSGVGMGIRRLSETCFLLGVFLMAVAFIQLNPQFLLNLFVQSMGYYFQNLIQLGFHCDAFEQSGDSGGASDRDRLTLTDNSPEQSDVHSWMNFWTMFYWGWWTSWCSFVGMFIAKISKGRTVRQFINGTLTAPVLYSFLWLIIFGGNGLLLERTSAAKGYCCLMGDKGQAFLNLSGIESVISERSLFDEPIISNHSDFLCDGNEGCGPCSLSFLRMKEDTQSTYGELIDEYRLMKDDFVRASPDRRYSRLSCNVKGQNNVEKTWFDVMRAFGDIGYFFCLLSLGGIVLYFVTSADSGSLVIDCLASNGDPDPPKIQRFFWAVTEGATATALILAGEDSQGLKMLQNAGLISGLPYTLVVCLLCVSIWRYVKMVMGDLNVSSTKFQISLFDAFFTRPYLKWNKSVLKEMMILFIEFICEVFLAPFTVGKVASILYATSSSIFQQLIALSFLILTLVFGSTSFLFSGFMSLAIWWYVCFTAILTIVRMKAREELELAEGNIVEDFFASLLMYPCVSLQLRYEFLSPILASRKSTQSSSPSHNDNDVESHHQPSEHSITKM